MTDLYKQIVEWGLAIFADEPLDAKLEHLDEEITELKDELAKRTPDMYKLGAELADCALMLVSISSLFGIDLEQAISSKFEINKTRVWGVPDSNGVIRHEDSPPL